MGNLGAIWGIGGVCLMLVSAIVRLTPVAMEAFGHPMGPWHLTAMAVFLPYMVWSEGIWGFQRRFSPRVAARARHLRAHPRLLDVALAPLFCAGFYRIVRRRQLFIWALTAGIVVLIVAIRRLDQPWRGIVDLGVVAGLAWGLASVAIFALRALTAAAFPYSPELPGKRES